MISQQKSTCLFVLALACLGVCLASPVAVVHHNPTTVVKTEQVHSGDQSSYSYSSEVHSNPTVVHHAVATPVASTVVAASPVVHTSSVVASPVVHSAAVVASPIVSTYSHAYPSYTYPYSYYSPYSYYGYSPLSYVLKK